MNLCLRRAKKGVKGEEREAWGHVPFFDGGEKPVWALGALSKTELPKTRGKSRSNGKKIWAGVNVRFGNFWKVSHSPYA